MRVTIAYDVCQSTGLCAQTRPNSAERRPGDPCSIYSA